MNKTYTITSQQVSDIHNAMCYMRFAFESLNEMLKDDSSVIRNLEKAINSLKPVRDDVVGRKDADYDKIRDMASRVAKLNGFNHTIWSIYDLGSFDDKSPVPVGSTLISEYSGDQTSVTVNGSTWLDLWKATDDLVKQAQDMHGDHIFIEFYKQSSLSPDTFYVHFGS